MTDVLADTQPIPVGTPDHSASSIPRVEGGERVERPGVFGRLGGALNPTPTTRKKREEKPTESKEIPKLAPHMKKKITDFYILVGGALTPFDRELGQTIIDQAPKCGSAVYDFAQENAAFRRVIQSFLTTSMWGALVFAHLPILLMTLRHARSEKVRFTAGMMMVSLKLMEQQDADEAFGDKVEETPIPNAA